MASKKVKDLAVKTGTYTDSSGAQKGRYKNVGSLMKSDDGSFFILMDTTFNPAGVPNPDNRDNVLISVFDLRDDSQAGGSAGSGGARGGAPQRQRPAPATSAPVDDYQSDDIPFVSCAGSF